MANAELLGEGLRILVLGMGIVFGFLVILVFAMKAMSRVAAVIEGKAGVEPVAAAPPTAPALPGDEPPVAVIGAAIHRYRNRRRRQSSSSS
ncbi:MAG: OadG family transporter subunit [Pseudomonadota bacterium]